jgi:hypothetical protein
MRSASACPAPARPMRGEPAGGPRVRPAARGRHGSDDALRACRRLAPAAVPKHPTCHSQASLKRWPPRVLGPASQRAAPSARPAAAAPAPPGAYARPPRGPGPDPAHARARMRLRRERRRLGERVEVPQRDRQRDQLLRGLVLYLPGRGRACGESGVALANELRYRSANVSATGSCMSITVFSSGLSADVLCLRPGSRASARRRRDRTGVARLARPPRALQRGGLLANSCASVSAARARWQPDRAGS